MKIYICGVLIRLNQKIGFNENSELTEDKLPIWDSSECDDIIFLEHTILTNTNEEDNTLRLLFQLGMVEFKLIGDLVRDGKYITKHQTVSC